MTKKRRKNNTPKQHQIQRPQSQTREARLDFVVEAEQFSGPIPHPDLLRQYEEIAEGSANRILKMAEEQGAHRRHLERTHLQQAGQRANLGLWLGFVVSIVAIVAGTVIILAGHEAWGFSLILGDILLLAAAFITGKVSQSRERTRKAKLPVQVTQRR